MKSQAVLDAEKKVQKAKIQLLMGWPFFGMIALKRPFVVEENGASESAYVTASGEIHFNAAFVNSLDVFNIVFLIAHEAMHVVYAHLARMGDRDPGLWNYAADASINDLLKRQNVGMPIEGGVFIDGAADKTTEQLYEEWSKVCKSANAMMQQKKSEQQNQQEQKGQQSQQKDGQGDQGQIRIKPHICDLKPEEAQKASSTEAQAKQAVAEGRLEISQALQSAKMMGKADGGLQELMAKALRVSMPWHEVLEKYLSAKTQVHRSWSRPNKRYAGRYYLPRREGQPSMGDMVVAIDESGSISDDDVAEFMYQVNRIVELVHPKKVTVLHVTTFVREVEVFTPDEYPIELKGKRWSGGTDMTAGQRWLEENDPEAEVFLCFTDGETPYDSEGPTDYDVVWVLTKDYWRKPIYGQIVCMED